jgi:uncharacterized protein YcfL
MKQVLIAVGIATLLAGCSSNPFSEKTTVNIEKGEVNVVPKWFVTPPDDSEDRLYAVGTALSNDMQFSMDKALHSAKITLGDKMVSKASAETRAFVEDNSKKGLSLTTRQTTKVSKSGFKKVDVSKYVIEKKEVTLEDKNFRTYLLMSLNPLDREHGEDGDKSIDGNEKTRAETALETL